jgi:hypothetical protein
MKLVFCDSTQDIFTPFNHHLVKISCDLILCPEEICLCVIKTQPTSPIFHHIIIHHDNFTFYPTRRHRATLMIVNNTNKTLMLHKNETLDTITSLNNVRFSFGFVAERDIQRYVCQLIQNL